jgi:hypothetical protein
MATEYKFAGSKDPFTTVTGVHLAGSTPENPVDGKYVELNGTIELSDEELEDLRSRGFKLTKVGDPDEDEKAGADAPAEENRAGADKPGDAKAGAKAPGNNPAASQRG